MVFVLRVAQDQRRLGGLVVAHQFDPADPGVDSDVAMRAIFILAQGHFTVPVRELESHFGALALHLDAAEFRAGVTGGQLLHCVGRDRQGQQLAGLGRLGPAVGGGTKVEFSLDFKFRSRILEKMIGPLFSKATNAMVNAFRQRANQLYGTQQI